MDPSPQPSPRREGAGTERRTSNAERRTRNIEHPDFLPLVWLGIAAFAFHAVTTTGGLFWLDAGDFVTASCELGVPHPTGYPLYVVLGKLVCLVPLGSAAFRVALLSAAFAGLLTSLLAWLIRAAMPGSPRSYWIAASAVAAVALWTTGVAGLAGRTPDVYALHAVLTALAIWLTLRVGERGQLSDWLLLGFVLGLGLSNHAEYRLFLPIFIVISIIYATPTLPTPRIKALAGRLAGMASTAVVGLLPYLYLPIASQRAPYHAWGQPDSWARFWDHVSGRSIQQGFEAEFLSLSWVRLRPALSTFFDQIWTDFGELLILFPLALVVLLVRRRRLGLLALALLACDVGYAVVVNPMGLRDQQNGATTYFVIALTIGIGAHALAEWVGGADRLRASGRLRRIAAVAVFVSVAMLALLGTRGSEIWLVESWGAEDLTFDGLQTAPEGALVITATEDVVSARLYLVGIGAQRPDLQVLHTSELSDSRLLLKRHTEGPFSLVPPEEAESWANWGLGATIETHLHRLQFIAESALESGRAVLWGSGSALESNGRWDRIAIGFPFHRLLAERAPIERPAVNTFIPLAPTWPTDLWGRRWASQYTNYVGNVYARRGRFRDAMEAFVTASEYHPTWASPLVNLGVLEARSGNFGLAENLAAMATERDPLNVTAWLNLARYRGQLGRCDDARDALTHARAVESDHPAIAEVTRQLEACGAPR